MQFVVENFELERQLPMAILQQPRFMAVGGETVLRLPQDALGVANDGYGLCGVRFSLLSKLALLVELLQGERLGVERRHVRVDGGFERACLGLSSLHVLLEQLFLIFIQRLLFKLKLHFRQVNLVCGGAWLGRRQPLWYVFSIGVVFFEERWLGHPALWEFETVAPFPAEKSWTCDECPSRARENLMPDRL